MKLIVNIEIKIMAKVVIFVFVVCLLVA